jgi:hypothetical protein
VPRLNVIPLLFALLASLVVSSALAAAPRDRAASDKIDEAINKHYLATEFDKAENILKGTLDACEERCSPEVKARAWMYIGIVRGSGLQNIRGAQEAFQQALALDPKVQLDEALATPDVKEAFDAAASTLGQSPAPSSKGGGDLADDDLEGDMECTPTVREVETRRAIPVACTTDEPASKVQLRYKVFGADTWVSVAMVRKGEYWTGEIPCSDTGISGKLRWFVRAQDAGGDTVDSHGSKKNPAEIDLVNSSDEDPPKYPGQAAPPRCMDAASCPEDMIGTPACPGTGGKGARGTKGWGAPCDTSIECEEGLLCLQGDTGRTCESAPSCDGDADCPADHVCKAGTCNVGEGGDDAPTGPFKQNLVGLHFGYDIAWVTGTEVCSPQSQFSNGFACFYPPDATGAVQQFGAGTPTGGGGNVGGGFAPGTLRIMASYERAFTPNIGAEARLGFAFNSAPNTVDASFLPVHVEVRGKYWFGRNALGKQGVRPFIALGGGVAQVDAKVSVKVNPCRSASGRANDLNDVLTCSPNEAVEQDDIDAYKKLGQIFLAGAGGLAYAFLPEHSVVLNVNLMLMLPTTGFVMEPSLGYLFGF